MRSNVTLQQYLYEIRHEVDQVKKSTEYPDGLLRKWAHKDICETALRLGAAINQLYRKLGTVTIEDAAGAYEATASHIASATTVTGFTGLDANKYAGGAVIAVVTDKIYAAQIVSNTATEVTISLGTALPAMETLPVFLSSNDSNIYASLSSLSMMQFEEPIWAVTTSDGETIEQITVEEARNITSDPMNADEAYWYKLGERIALALGSSKSVSGDLTVGYYEKPVEAVTLATDYIDFPIEYHDLAQQRTMIRIMKKMNLVQEAQAKEADLENRWQQIDRSNQQTHRRDVMSGERKPRNVG